MKALNNIKIGTRLNLILGTVVAVSIIILGSFVYNMQKRQFLNSTDAFIKQQTEDIAEVMRVLTIEKLYANSAAFRTGVDFFTSGVNYEINNRVKYTYTITNQENGEQKQVQLPELTKNEVVINNDTALVDRICFLSYGHTMFYQRFEGGFVSVLSDLKDTTGNRIVHTYLPNEHFVAKVIDTVPYIGGELNPPPVVFNGVQYMAAYFPIKINGRVEGMICSLVKEIDMNFMSESINTKVFPGNGYASILTPAGLYKLHPQKTGQSIKNTELYSKIVESGNNEGKIEINIDGSDMLCHYFYESHSDYYVIVASYKNEIMKSVARIRVIIIIALIVILVVFILVNRFISSSITGSLSKAVAFATSVANGKLNSDLNINQNDEVGQMAYALNQMVARLRVVVSGIVEGADHIVSASSQINSTASELSQSSNRQASSVEEVSATIEQMVSAIQNGSESANETERISGKAFEGMKKMAQNAMNSLESTKGISQKVLIINDIAFQTNILALNAAVEAARAGEYGRGFAVVAGEVRKLADESKKASDHIQLSSNESIAMAQATGNEMNNVSTEFEKATVLIKAIAESGKEQLNGAEQINSAMINLNSIAQQTAASSEELASNSEELASQAEHFKEVISYFKVD